MKWLLFVFILLCSHLSFCSDVNSADGDKSLVDEKIELSYIQPISFIPDSIKTMALSKADSVIGLYYYPRQIKGLALDTLIVLEDTTTKNYAISKANIKAIVQYRNTTFDSLATESQAYPYLVVYIFPDGCIYNGDFKSIPLDQSLQFLNVSAIRKKLLSNYPNKEFELNNNGQIKVTFGFASKIICSSNQLRQQNIMPEVIKPEGGFYYTVSRPIDSYSFEYFIINARNGNYICGGYSTLLESE
ncbi:MAG: hypothetical protein R2728_16170 [Chitinophagales bacterium]